MDGINSSKPVTQIHTDLRSQNDAAIKIQRFFRKVTIANAYTHMLHNGIDFRKFNLDDCTKVSALDDFQKVSSTHLQRIKQKLGALSSEEVELMRRVVDAPYFYQHQTVNKLDKFDPQKGTSELLIGSNKYLSDKGIDVHSNTDSEDIDRTCNNNFVFFSICIAENINEKPIVTTHQRQDFGYIAYLVEEHHGKYGFLTLYDQSYPTLQTDTDYLTSQFIGLKIQAGNWAKKNHYSFGVPVFSYKDMKRAIGYYLIHFLRHCGMDEFREHIYSSSDIKTLNHILHTVFNLEYHIPNKLKITQGFVRHILYPPDLCDAAQSADLFTLKKYFFAGYDSFSEYYQNCLIGKTQDEIGSAVSGIKNSLEKVKDISKYYKHEHKPHLINRIYEEINDYLLTMS